MSGPTEAIGPAQADGAQESGAQASGRSGRFGRIDQFVPSLALHDAIGNHVMQTRRLLRAAGYQSEIFYEHVDPRLAVEGRPFRDSPAGPDPDRLILYHASTHSDMTGWLVGAAGRGQRFVIDYHNITPPGFFSRWEPQAARSMDLGRRQLAQIAPLAIAGLSDSAYNAAELADLGQADSRVCPLLLDLEEFHQTPDPVLAERLARRGGPLWLFVGRIAPNKCQHDVIAAFALYRRAFSPGARLALVGGATSRRYQSSLVDMVEDLDLASSVDLVGSAPFPEMLAYFQAADVFVCLSEHEGFCVPVVEAMELGVPVVAYPAAAVTETVAGAGVLLDSKDPLDVAVAVDSVLSDPLRSRQLADAGRSRASQFALTVSSQRWLDELGALATGPGDRPDPPGASHRVGPVEADRDDLG